MTRRGCWGGGRGYAGDDDLPLLSPRIVDCYQAQGVGAGWDGQAAAGGDGLSVEARVQCARHLPVDDRPAVVLTQTEGHDSWSGEGDLDGVWGRWVVYLYPYLGAVAAVCIRGHQLEDAGPPRGGQLKSTGSAYFPAVEQHLL